MAWMRRLVAASSLGLVAASACANSDAPELDGTRLDGSSGSSNHLPEEDEETPTPTEEDPDEGIETDIEDLFPDEPGAPTTITREGSTIVTRVADRGRRRHEPSCSADALGQGPDTCDFDNYHFMYWTRNARTLEWTLRDDIGAEGGTFEVTVDMKSAHAQNGANEQQNVPQLRCFTQYGTVTGFYQNYAMAAVEGSTMTATRFRTTLSSYSDATQGGASRPLRAGDLIECEITLRWQELVERGFQANYYSRRIRYVAGQGGLWGFNRDPNIGPVSSLEAQLLGGRTTDTVRSPGERGRSFMQFALNGSHEELTSFLDGRRLFRTSFVDGRHRDPTGTFDPAAAQPVFEEAALGVAPPIAEAEARCSGCHENDGGGPVFPGMTRAAPALVGLGLLEAIRVEDLLENEATQASEGRVHGRLRRETRDGRVLAGRFGWMGTAVSVREQTRTALEAEMGVEPDELPPRFIDELVAYLSLLAVPAPRAEDLWDLPGARVFAELGCADCHRTRPYVTGSHPFQSLRAQTIVPFTDLLVHDFGSEELRTTPLWGLGLKALVRGEARYLHDDSATSIAAAIKSHSGDAAASALAFTDASPESRSALLEFLEAL